MSYLSEVLTRVDYDNQSFLFYEILNILYSDKTTYVHLVQSVFDIEKRNTKRKVSSETMIT